MLLSGRAILRFNLRTALSYRVDLLTDLLSSALLLGIYFFLWRAIFQAQSTVQGLTFEYMTGYIVLVRVVQGFSQTGTLEFELADRIREGAIATDLLRPYSIQLYYYLKSYSHALLGALLISLPIVLFALFVLHLLVPTPLRLGLFLVSLHLSFAVNVGLSFLVGLAAFPLKNNEGVIQLKRFVTNLLSGSLFPLVLLPGELGTFNEFLPFRAIVDVPVGIYLGNAHPTLLIFQLAWALGLGLLGRVLLRKARRNLVILGG